MEGATIFDSIPPPSGPGPPRNIQPEVIRDSVPWAFFDGASDINGRCGAGLVIHLSTSKSLRASVGLGQGTKNFAELKALHSLLCWLISRQMRMIQIFGDSKNIVNWFNRTQQCRNYILLPFLKEIYRIKCFFTEITVCHIYKERNQDTDRLSKEGSIQAMGTWIVTEMENRVFHPLEQPVFG